MMEYKPTSMVIRQALAFAVKAAGEGLCIDGLSPEEFLLDYSEWSGLEDWDAIPDLIAAQVDDALAEDNVKQAAKVIFKASVNGDKWSFPPAVIDAMRNYDERHADIPDESAASYYGLMLINALIELAGMAEPPLPDNVERLWR
jgi:hypothetical protein